VIPELSDEEQDVLLSVDEGSDLWEVAASLSNLLGDESSDRPRRLGEEILIRFAVHGWLRLYRQEVVGDARSDREEVGLDRLPLIVADDRNWLVPADRPETEFYVYAVAASPRTKELVRAGAINGAIRRTYGMDE
jgi:hypothetical protein